MHASQSFFGDIAVALLCLIIGPTLAEAQIVEDFNPGANELIWATACQPDGKIWVGGAFTSLGASPRLCLGRLLPDGTLDPTPDIPFAGQRWVTCLALQPDGKILVSGWFFIPNRATNICRLNADGSLDSSFVGRSDRPIYSLLLQRDGKIVVGGCFTNLAGQSRQSIGRLRPDGSLDASFLSDAPGTVNTLALQLDGKILVGGSFTNLGGVPRNNLGRLNADGSVDLNFDPAPNLPVTAIQLQPNGQIVVTGDFYLISGQSRSRLARINNDGTLDSTFSPQPHGQIFSLALQADGKILAGGFFTTFGDQATTNLARLNSDGSVDASFSLSTDYYLQSLALQADGKLIAAGYFSEVNGLGRSCIARLDIGTASETLSSDGFTINWMRLGSVPELQGCTFAYSTNGTDWVDLGPGSVAPGSWQLTGIAIPASSSIWALGSVSGGYYNGSSWLVSSFYGPPAIISQPLSRTNSAGSIAPFSVVAGGSSPVKYCWLKNGNALAGGANITGVTTPLLVLSNVLGADAG